MMKVSVIIPVFNAEKYIETCLDSVLGQTYGDFEVVVVDDGSTDQSGIVCDRFMEQDGRVKVLHKKNEGLISARITGIMAADGDYIAFVDADDWIDADFFETGIGQMEREAVDMVIMGCVMEKRDCQEPMLNRIGVGVYDSQALSIEVFPQMLHYQGFYEFGILPYIWNKIYKRQMLQSCYDNIDTKIYDGEDAAVVYPYLLKSQKVVITKDAKYHYRIHGESMTANRKADYYENTARLYLHLAKKFQESEYSQCMMPQLDQYMRMMIWQGKPGGFIESMKFIFPFKEIHKGASIILYGAGYVGQMFHHQILLSEYCNIAAWVDKAYQREELSQMGVVGMEALYTEAYDYVVLAIQDSGMAAEITEQLVAYGVCRDQIIFCV